MCFSILVWAHYWSRNGRNNVLIGLPGLAKEKKLSKIVINRSLPNIWYSLSVFVKERHFTIFFTNLINSKLISALVSSDKSVFLCIYATQVWRILISITIFFAHAQSQNSANKTLNTKRNIHKHQKRQKRQIGGVLTNHLLDVWKTLLSFSKYFWFNTFSQNIKYCSVAFSPLFSIA